MVLQLVPHLPAAFDYRIVLMQRDLDEVIASQDAMLERRGEPTDQLPTERLREVYGQQIAGVRRWIDAQRNVRYRVVRYEEAVAAPERVAREVASFLGRDLQSCAMAAAVDAALYRRRGGRR